MTLKKMILLVGLLVTYIYNPILAQSEFVEIYGRVTDVKSKRPVESCNVYVRGEGIGTVANSDGEFLIKIPVTYIEENLVFSNLGYESFEVPIMSLRKGVNEIRLKPTVIVMEELVVRDPEVVLSQSISRFPENYPIRHQLLTAFYREIIKKNNSFVDISQGILDVFKLPYQHGGNDQIRINKGFRSQDYKRQDTLAFKLMGGPTTMLLLDVVQNPSIILTKEVMQYYDYDLTDIREFDGKRHLEISFEPKDPRDLEAYSGKIYVEEKTLAISQMEFGYPPAVVKVAGKKLIRDKPKLARLTPLKVQYSVKYREFNGRWHLYYARNELEIRCNWKKRLFNTTFRSIAEMVVTDRSMRDVQPFDKTARTQKYVVFSDEAEKYNDETFWENYIIIKPEDDITKALHKIGSKENKIRK